MVRVTVARLSIHEGRLPAFAQPEAILRDRHLRWFERDSCRGLSRLQCGDLRLGQRAGLVPLRLVTCKETGVCIEDEIKANVLGQAQPRKGPLTWTIASAVLKQAGKGNQKVQGKRQNEGETAPEGAACSPHEHVPQEAGAHAISSQSRPSCSVPQTPLWLLG